MWWARWMDLSESSAQMGSPSKPLDGIPNSSLYENQTVILVNKVSFHRSNLRLQILSLRNVCHGDSIHPPIQAIASGVPVGCVCCLMTMVVCFQFFLVCFWVQQKIWWCFCCPVISTMVVVLLQQHRCEVQKRLVSTTWTHIFCVNPVDATDTSIFPEGFWLHFWCSRYSEGLWRPTTLQTLYSNLWDRILTLQCMICSCHTGFPWLIGEVKLDCKRGRGFTGGGRDRGPN